MARSSPATLRRALLGALVLALLCGVLQYVVGIPSREAGPPLARLSVATVATGATIVSVGRPLLGGPDLFGGAPGRMERAAIGGAAFRPSLGALLLIALGNTVLFFPLLWLGLGAVEHVQRARARPATPRD
ncbi:MAG TPA: hypothetical protein VFS40_13165 [Gemmatimonadales bacterium]|nr:hypothetical protein [Gemmatimonadales bacterium]